MMVGVRQERPDRLAFVASFREQRIGDLDRQRPKLFLSEVYTEREHWLAGLRSPKSTCSRYQASAT